MIVNVNYCSVFQCTRNTGHDIVGNTALSRYLSFRQVDISLDGQECELEEAAPSSDMVIIKQQGRWGVKGNTRQHFPDMGLIELIKSNNFKQQSYL